jgi:hypothetical protein
MMQLGLQPHPNNETMGVTSADVVIDLDTVEVPEGTLPTQRTWAGAPRVATPVIAALLITPARGTAAAMVLDFPEPAIAFDRRGACICVNEKAAAALGLDRRSAVGSGVAALPLPRLVAAALRFLTGPAPEEEGFAREVTCDLGGVERHFVGTIRPDSGDVLVTWTDFDPLPIHVELVEVLT